jgi:DNA-binding NarL/FixJ family response regulator
MRILIADGQDRVRHALMVLLTRQPGLQVVGEASDGQELMTHASVTEADLALVDWDLPGLSEAGGLLALRSLCPALQVVVLSSRPGARQAARAAGVDAFVSKGDPPERLLAVIRRCGAMAR